MTEPAEMTAKIGEKTETPRAKTETVARAGAPKIRAAIVGAGLMGLWHTHALTKAGGRVVGIADFDTARAGSLAARYAGAKAFDDIETMIAEQKPDVLHVCSPTGSHEEIAEKALSAGVHLLIEKPLAATAAQTSKLFERAARNNTLVCPVHQFAFQGGALKAEKNLSKIGRLVHLEASICSAGGAGLSGDRLDRIAADILPHPLSLIQKFKPLDFSTIQWDDPRHPAAGELRISGRAEEVSLSIFISLNTRPTVNTFRLSGSEGTIHLDLFHGYSIIEPGKISKARKILHPFDLAVRNLSAAAFNLIERGIRREPAYPGLRRLIEKFYEAVKTGSAPPITAAETIAIAETRDSLLKRAGIGPAED